MSTRKIGILLFLCLFGVQPVHADFLNMGAGEIILVLISSLFFLGFFAGLVFIVYVLIKKSNSKSHHPLPTNMANVGNPIFVSPSSDKSQVDQKHKLTQNLRDIKIPLPQQHEIRYVSVIEILRCEADDNYTNFHLQSGEKVLISKSLKEYTVLLSQHGFLRTHQSHLINPAFVRSWLKEDGGVLLMNNGDKIPVSKANRERVKEELCK